MLLPSPIQATTLPSQPAEALAHGQQVGHHLAGCSRSVSPLMTGIERVARQLLDVGMIEGADHDAVEIAGEHPRRVADRLAAAELDVAGREEQRVAAELVGADLERDPRAGGALREDHRERLARERLLLVIAALHPGGQIEAARGARRAVKSGIARKWRVGLHRPEDQGGSVEVGGLSVGALAGHQPRSAHRVPRSEQRVAGVDRPGRSGQPRPTGCTAAGPRHRRSSSSRSRTPSASNTIRFSVVRQLEQHVLHQRGHDGVQPAGADVLHPVVGHGRDPRDLGDPVLA